MPDSDPVQPSEWLNVRFGLRAEQCAVLIDRWSISIESSPGFK
jgi:hypothetical protein